MRNKNSGNRHAASTHRPSATTRAGPQVIHQTKTGTGNRFRELLSRPINGASLAAVRIAVGLAMILEASSICRPSDMIQGDLPLYRYFTGPDIKFHFPYEFCSWLPLLPSPWIQVVIALLALAGLSMAIGFCYRASAITVFLTWGYLFSVESTRTYWQSYYYVELLFTFLLLWMPAARRFSVDSWLARGQNRETTVPFWTVFVLRGQLVIAYFYAGVSKLSTDWLLDAVPLRWDLAEAHVVSDLQPYLSPAHLEFIKHILHSEFLAYLLAYAGTLFDLTIGFVLLNRRTRTLGMILMVLFHATNHFVIYANIDWFPLVGITTATIFLEPDWPERFWRWLRHPRIPRPDWNWFTAGALIIPVLGAALGWKSKPSAPASRTTSSGSFLPRWVVPAVVGWLMWQTWMPLRHYFIPGDGRFTYEGLSFSWRLKADDHSALTAQLYVDDPEIISRDAVGRTKIDWNQWHGEKVVYRRLSPGGIRWQELPEILALLEPIAGERILYNPHAATATLSARTEVAAVERVKAIWRRDYGREPESVRVTIPLDQGLQRLATNLAKTKLSEESAQLAGLAERLRAPEPPDRITAERARTRLAIRATLSQLRNRPGADGASVVSTLRQVNPFALEGEETGGFLVIDDRALLVASDSGARRVDRAAWKNSPQTSGPRGPNDSYLGPAPLIVYISDIGPEAKTVLPEASIFDSQDHPDRLPYVWWNSLKDLSSSKLMHVASQPFYLRRYARRIASLWEQDYGRRPAVKARTALSFNGRPHQPLVDPAADLAKVSVTWFGHNQWIKDLETARVPPDRLSWNRQSRTN